MDTSKEREKHGNRIRKAREEAGLTQAQVAKKAGLGANYFAVIERGEVTTSGVNLQKIANAIGIDISQITK